MHAFEDAKTVPPNGWNGGQRVLRDLPRRLCRSLPLTDAHKFRLTFAINQSDAGNLSRGQEMRVLIWDLVRA
jgi:hypothetical protein